MPARLPGKLEGELPLIKGNVMESEGASHRGRDARLARRSPRGGRSPTCLRNSTCHLSVCPSVCLALASCSVSSRTSPQRLHLGAAPAAPPDGTPGLRSEAVGSPVVGRVPGQDDAPGAPEGRWRARGSCNALCLSGSVSFMPFAAAQPGPSQRDEWAPPPERRGSAQQPQALMHLRAQAMYLLPACHLPCGSLGLH